MSQGEGEDAIYTIRERQEVSSGIWKLFTTVQRGENGAPIDVYKRQKLRRIVRPSWEWVTSG